jgi:ubiquinone/menaquinone biosynthesis C-methylase UbiE
VATTPSWEARKAAEDWRDGAPARLLFNRPALNAMLDEAALRPGMRVLDLGAGTGDTTLDAARRVGPTGSVLAVDISRPMLDVLTEEARKVGLTNITTLAGDAAALELPPVGFDAAISANCVQFIPDVGAALRAVRRALRPGARFSLVVGPAPERFAHDGFSPEAIIRRIGRLSAPPPDAPHYTRLGAPGRLEEELRAAGFADVATRPVPLMRQAPSADAFAQALTRNPNTSHLLDQLDDTHRLEALRAIKEEVAQFVTPEGVRIPSEMLLGAGEA